MSILSSRKFFWLILAVSALIKLPALFLPLIGHFGSYQSLYGMMAEMMMREGVSGFFVPQFYILERGLPAIRLLDYPFAAAVAATFKMIFGSSVDFWGRFQSVCFSLGSAALLYELTKKEFDERIGALAAFIFSFSPIVLITGVSFQNESSALFWLILSVYLCFYERSGFIFLAGLAFSLAVTARFHFFLVAPFFIYLLWKKPLFQKVLFTFAFLSLLTIWLAIAYRINRTHPNVLTSIFFQMNEGRILFHPLWKKRSFYEHLFDVFTGPYLGPVFLPFLIASLFFKRKQIFPYLIWFLSSISVVFLLPQKVYDHPFYLLPSIAPAAILIAVAVTACINSLKLNKPAVASLFLLAVVMSLRFYVPAVFLSVEKNKHVPEIGRQVQRLSVPNDLIIAQNGSSPELLYYCDRKGWTFDLEMNRESFASHQFLFKNQEKLQEGYGDPIVWLEHLRRQGAKYLVISELPVFQKNQTFFSYVTKKYKQISLKPNLFLMFDLVQH